MDKKQPTEWTGFGTSSIAIPFNVRSFGQVILKCFIFVYFVLLSISPIQYNIMYFSLMYLSFIIIPQITIHYNKIQSNTKLFKFYLIT